MIGHIKERAHRLRLGCLCISYRLYLHDLLKTSLWYAHTSEHWARLDEISQVFYPTPLFFIADSPDEILDQIAEYKNLIKELYVIISQ